MRLENLYPNFMKLSYEDQIAFITSYRQRRAMDLENVTIKTVARKKSVKDSKIELSAEEKNLMKMLGLKMKDVEALRDSLKVQETPSNDEELFADNTFGDVDDDE